MIHLQTPSGKKTQCTEAELYERRANGQLEPGTLYWRDGMDQWRPFETFFDDTDAVPLRDGKRWQ